MAATIQRMLQGRQCPTAVFRIKVYAAKDSKNRPMYDGIPAKFEIQGQKPYGYTVFSSLVYKTPCHRPPVPGLRQITMIE